MLKSIYLRILIALIFLIFLFACNNAGDVRHQETSGSSKTSNGQIQPESFKHIILTWQDDPGTSQAVTWRTDVAIEAALAEIVPSDPSPDFSKGAKQFKAATSRLETGQGLSYYHTVNFTKLHPDTLYAYRVGNGKVWREWFQFRTAGAKPEPFSFIYLGDAQYDIYSRWSRTIRAAFLAAPKARFMIHAGDMVDHPNSDREWNEWFKAGGWLLAMIPSIPRNRQSRV